MRLIELSFIWKIWSLTEKLKIDTFISSEYAAPVKHNEKKATRFLLQTAYPELVFLLKQFFIH